MLKCYLCNGEVSWQADDAFEDYGYEGEGIIHRYVCRECGAEIEVKDAITNTALKSSKGK